MPDTNTPLTTFLKRVRQHAEEISFTDTLSLIDHLYRHTPAAFRVGEQHNAAGTNNGSSKILAFARLHGLSEANTLQLFGDYYRKDVCEHPEGDDHANIRQFQRCGWEGVVFEQDVLTPR